MKIPTAVQTALSEFLAEHRESDGGWAAITPGDITKLYRLVDALIEAKCAADADGDYPIQVVIVNRRTHEHLHARPIPYTHAGRNLASTPALAKAALDIAMMNLSIAAGAADRAWRILQDTERGEIV